MGSRGTENGLHYSEQWAGGDATNLLIVSWVMAASLGAEPELPDTRSGDPQATGHIVCRNPVADGNQSTGEMYCVPVAVVAFGEIHTEYTNCGKPVFRDSAERKDGAETSVEELLSRLEEVQAASTEKDETIKELQMQ